MTLLLFKTFQWLLSLLRIRSKLLTLEYKALYYAPTTPYLFDLLSYPFTITHYASATLAFFLLFEHAKLVILEHLY